MVSQLRKLKRLRCDLHFLRKAEAADAEEFNRKTEQQVNESSKSLQGLMGIGHGRTKT